MPEWLIALAILVVVAILLDGVRRMRNARRDSLQMSLNMHQGIHRDELDEFGNEFPSGAARVVAQRTDESDAPDENIQQVLTDTGRRRIIDFEQVAPMLMDVKVDRQQRIEPGFGSDDDDLVSTDEKKSAQEDVEKPSNDFDPEKTLFGLEETIEDKTPVARGVKNASPVFDTSTTPLGLGESEVVSKPRVYERPADQPPPRREAPVIKPSKPVIQAREERGQQNGLVEQKNHQLPLEDVIIISVMARDRSGFPGAALLEILLANGLRYGHRSIFHCYTGEEREEESLYSVANAVKPGTFDLNKMESFNTPGVTLFLALPSPGDKPMEAFDAMLATARAIAMKLHGELRDENRSVMMGQTIEHCRQRIRDFDMQSRLRAR
jgi:cell division protein ZipA